MRDPHYTNYTPNETPGVTPSEHITVHSSTVACDGGGGPLGHPTIYLRIEHGRITCPYCSRTYILAEGAAEDSHH